VLGVSIDRAHWVGHGVSVRDYEIAVLCNVLTHDGGLDLGKRLQHRYSSGTIGIL
jgi:hypothetical protein